MGADFIERATPSFKKSWDREKVALGTADLFTRTPECAARTASAELIGDAILNVGDWVTVEAQDTVLIARQGIRDVARMLNPPPAIRQAVADSCGIAKGTIEQVHTLSGVVEISLR